MLNRTKAGTTINVYISMSLLVREDSTPVGMIRACFDVNAPQLQPALAPSEEDARTADSDYPRPVVVHRDVNGTPFIIASTLMHKFMASS